MTPDATDRVILQMLQENARTSNAEIGRALGIAPSAVLERIRKLEQRGVIEGYHAKINPKALGLGFVAFIHMVTSYGPDFEQAVAEIAAMPELEEVHETLGDVCLLLKARVADMDELNTLLTRFRQNPHVVNTNTIMVMATQKDAGVLPIPDQG